VLSSPAVSDSGYYFLRIDTNGVDLGYLRIDPAGAKLAVGELGGDFSVWKIVAVKGQSDEYRLVNRGASDTLRLSPVTAQPDTIAAADADGSLSHWFELAFSEGSKHIFKTFHKDENQLVSTFCLTMNDEGEVMLSLTALSSSEPPQPAFSELPPLNFSVERAVKRPDPNKYYRLKIDTLGAPDVNPTGFLSADTTNSRRDSLAAYKTLKGDLSLWKLSVDTIVHDTTYFKISNKATAQALAFDVPQADTVAYMQQSGALSRWMIPFYVEENGIGKLLVRDTTATAIRSDYYLALKDTVVMLVADTAAYQCIKFVAEEDHLMDTTAVYRVKYLNGTDSGRYLGVNARGIKTPLDTVYAHLPDGQFVVHKDNKYALMSRSGDVTTAQDHLSATDSLSFVYDTQADTLLRFQYTNGVDTFEITPVTYGEMDTKKRDPHLGYKYLPGDSLSRSAYAFSYVSADTLNGRVMGYAPSDSLAIVLPGGDTARFVVEADVYPGGGAPEIAGIPRLTRLTYYLRASDDTTLYLSVRPDALLCVDTVPHQASFFLKADTIPDSDACYFIENADAARKLLVDSTKYLYLATADTSATHLFAVTWGDRYPPEPDPYEYLTYKELGRGLYMISSVVETETYLTRNYYDYAVFSQEGQSMLRAGSYMPSDFYLWIDTAWNQGANPLKQWFYIVNNVDTVTSGAQISGYFLHVTDTLTMSTEEGGYAYNRLNFVKATRSLDTALLLESSNPQAKDSVGFVGKNEKAINEYRFYLQKKAGIANEYYIVTEQGYGKSGNRGYLSSAPNPELGKANILYAGPRDGGYAVTISVADPVSNEVVPPKKPKPEDVIRKIAIIGGDGQVAIHNASGERVTIYNVLGQPVADRTVNSDKETIAVSRGILIVKVGGSKTQKVVVK
jgi:hypothetical protein